MSEIELKDAVAQYLVEKLNVKKISMNDISMSASIDCNDVAYDFKATYILIEQNKL